MEFKIPRPFYLDHQRYKVHDIDYCKAGQVCDEACEGHDEKTLKANKYFHEKLISSVKNPFLAETYERMNSIIYLFSKTVVERQRPNLIEEHAQIVEAVEEQM